jgi:hypothetical protein
VARSKHPKNLDSSCSKIGRIEKIHSEVPYNKVYTLAYKSSESEGMEVWDTASRARRWVAEINDNQQAGGMGG